MAILIKNDNGIVALEDDILRDIIIDAFEGHTSLLLCNKKGNQQKKKASIRIMEENSRLCIAMYVLVSGGNSIDYLNQEIDKQFELIVDILYQIAIKRDIVCDFYIVNLEKRLRRYYAYEK